MKDFENYECDGQMELFDIYPKSCCGVVPWLHKTKCYRPDEEKPQAWQVYYICPKCYKRAVDSDGWAIYSRGSLEDAKQKAVAIWNDPQTVFEICNVAQEYGIRLSRGYGEFEEWAELYNVDMEDFVGCVARLD